MGLRRGGREAGGSCSRLFGVCVRSIFSSDLVTHSRSTRRGTVGLLLDLWWFAASGLEGSLARMGSSRRARRRVGARGLWPSRVSIVNGLKGGRLCCFGGRSQGFLTFCSSLCGPYSVVSVAAAPISVGRARGREYGVCGPGLLGTASCAGGCFEALGELFSVGPLRLRADHLEG
ncbi:hypothetical protein DY000_02034636 [Brassica cretica]|uniref:Uncharacterized protein n=1 Tax=Brassica cretica TaxID=69181 RepID=A0ABQ7DW81_BRACR|nr:hypothetical protein DY000_02034636 [Brassica cretica]